MSIPRGGYASAWTQAGGAIAVVLPAIPGVAHVITAVEMAGYISSSAGALAGLAVQVTLSSTSVNQSLKLFGVPPTSGANAFSPWSEQWTGEIQCEPGEAVTIQYGGGVTGLEFLGVHFYDV